MTPNGAMVAIVLIAWKAEWEGLARRGQRLTRNRTDLAALRSRTTASFYMPAFARKGCPLRLGGCL